MVKDGPNTHHLRDLIRIRTSSWHFHMGPQIKSSIVSSQVAQTSWQLPGITQPCMPAFRNRPLFPNKKRHSDFQQGLPGQLRLWGCEWTLAAQVNGLCENYSDVTANASSGLGPAFSFAPFLACLMLCCTFFLFPFSCCFPLCFFEAILLFLFQGFSPSPPATWLAWKHQSLEKMLPKRDGGGSMRE